MTHLRTITVLFSLALFVLACGEPGEETERIMETDEVYFDDNADLAEFRIRADGMSVWLRPEVEPVFDESLGGDYWFLRGRTSHNLGGVSAQVDGRDVASAEAVSARVFEIHIDYRQMGAVISGEPLLLGLENERGEQWHLAIDVKSQMVKAEGSWRLYPWVNIVPIVDDGAVWLRGRVTTNEPVANLYAYNDDDSAPEHIRRQDDRRWQLDWHPLALPWAGSPPEYPVYIVAQDHDGQYHEMQVQILMRLNRAVLSSEGPEAVMPDASCSSDVEACMEGLHSLDTEECGSAREVIACGGLEWEGPRAPAISELLVGSSELQVQSSTWVQLDFGAPASEGAVLTVAATGSMESMDPIEVEEGARFIQVQVYSSDEPGSGTLTFSLGGPSKTAEFEVFDNGCLIISEYIEGSNNNNKAIELYNCGDHSLQLSDYYVCIYSNDATSCSNTVRLEPETLSPGGIFGLCRTTAESGTNPYPQISSNCGQVTSSVMNFNGDDRLLVFRDRDGSGTFTEGDEIMDAFGELAVRPSSLIWGNRTFRRCNFTPFDGQSAFDVHEYYTELPINTVDGYGNPVDPSQICQ